MDNYLTILYKAYFAAVAYEKELLSRHSDKEVEQIRNDQAVTESRKNNEVIRILLIKYIKSTYTKN